MPKSIGEMVAEKMIANMKKVKESTMGQDTRDWDDLIPEEPKAAPFDIKPVEGNREPVRKVLIGARDSGDDDAMEIPEFGPDPYVQDGGAEMQKEWDRDRHSPLLPHVQVKVEGIPSAEKMNEIARVIEDAIAASFHGPVEHERNFSVKFDHTTHEDDEADENDEDVEIREFARHEGVDLGDEPVDQQESESDFRRRRALEITGEQEITWYLLEGIREYYRVVGSLPRDYRIADRVHLALDMVRDEVR